MNSTKRKRSRLACKPCRERKRKCDGQDPCVTCTEWGYDCHYETPKRRRASFHAGSLTSPVSQTGQGLHSAAAGAPSTVDSDHTGLVRHLEANSGAAFVRKLGLKMDPSGAPRLHLFGWNVGARQLKTSDFVPPTTSTLSVVEITSLEHMKSLAGFYFDKLAPCYWFVDKEQFLERLEMRWKSTAMTPDLYDGVLAGVAALGCLFSQRNVTITELHLVRCAASTLDNHHLAGPPSLDLLTGWTLRTIYLRLTDTPHATWIASSTLMHLVEASGLHPRSHSSVLLPSAHGNPDIERGLVCVAHHLNTWASFDLGLSRVFAQSDDLPLLPAPSSASDYTAEVMGLLPVSISLDPGRSRDEAELTEKLIRVLGSSHTQPPSVLAQSNLTLCILRRIHSQNLDISGDLAERVLALLKKALACARRMVAACCPWHQVANVPFQIICVLLVLDTRSSLGLLPEAMQTVGLVASTYPTDTMREAYSTACLLVMLHQQRRRHDVAVFGEVLAVHHHQPEAEVPPSSPPADQPAPAAPSTQENMWLEALVADFPGLQGVDLDQFLSADMGAGFPMIGGVPDGSGL
ncbi:uncharacterized protein E0L32_000923 [Thyridium curvatum]|uniref:Zn(2)-C6 fungal-type domain-containing protein n=1 Tax=Thyridium curvatum TaxID=1093900 RepID=A0A507B135_9PEZI|nr:uncharacterized protein E0L32_000923 [Thyridium curvatum]TPX12746.1 hypothetical protein E0L32_000923 [Thyridium curvatum]